MTVKNNGTQSATNLKRVAVAGTVFAFLATGSAALAADGTAPRNREIGYVINDFEWALHQTEGAKTECPNGLNKLGPREQFKALYPENGAAKTIVDTQLAYESEVWWPSNKIEAFPFYEAQGKVAIGLDLDGKTDANDFTSPDGKAGIDNQLYRALGCIDNYRSGASVLTFDKTFFKKNQISRMLIHVTDVDSLANDDDVTVTTYRGQDPLMFDATGEGYVPGGTQRLDTRWGKEFINQAKGKIVDGELITEPLNFYLPLEIARQEAAIWWIREARFALRLTPERAEGLVAGYADVDRFYYSRNRVWSTHHLSYGQESSLSLHRALKRLADGLPDPATGENTGISSAMKLWLVQVHILPDNIPRTSNLAADTGVAVDGTLTKE
jgi:hypothetical protein